MVKVTFDVEKESWEAFKKHCQNTGRTCAGSIRLAIREWMKKQKGVM